MLRLTKKLTPYRRPKCHIKLLLSLGIVGSERTIVAPLVTTLTLTLLESNLLSLDCALACMIHLGLSHRPDGLIDRVHLDAPAGQHTVHPSLWTSRLSSWPATASTLKQRVRACSAHRTRSPDVGGTRTTGQPPRASERAHRPDVLDADTSGGAGPVHHRAVRLARTTPEPSNDPVLPPSRRWGHSWATIRHMAGHRPCLLHETAQFKVAVLLRTRWT